MTDGALDIGKTIVIVVEIKGGGVKNKAANVIHYLRDPIGGGAVSVVIWLYQEL